MPLETDFKFNDFKPKHVSCFMRQPGIKLNTEYHLTYLCYNCLILIEIKFLFFTFDTFLIRSKRQLNILIFTYTHINTLSHTTECFTLFLFHFYLGVGVGIWGLWSLVGIFTQPSEIRPSTVTSSNRELKIKTISRLLLSIRAWATTRRASKI